MAPDEEVRQLRPKFAAMRQALQEQPDPHAATECMASFVPPRLRGLYYEVVRAAGPADDLQQQARQQPQPHTDR